MYCAGCGQVVTSGKVCPKCGGPLNPLGQPGEAAALFMFERTLRSLRRYWFLFACLNVALGVAGLAMVQFGISHRAGPWEPWPHPPYLEWTYIGAVAWILLTVRVALAAAAGLRLRDHSDWTRLVTGLAAVMAMTQFPIGLLLGAFTLVKITGKRNREMFEKLTAHSS